MGYLGRFQFSSSYLNRVSAMDCPKHLGLCYSIKKGWNVIFYLGTGFAFEKVATPPHFLTISFQMG
jgi:hypothetical protein